MTRLHIVIHGAVQGIGFRPFVYRLAVEMRLNGWVVNSSEGVFIEVEGDRPRLDDFVSRLVEEKPRLASIQGMECSFLDPSGFRKFEIRESESDGQKCALVLPDIATCSECASEVFDPGNRRYLYPFTNCTNCGPRFSIITSLPYDRNNTTMAKFEMCEECRREYDDPSNRRFHAQPNACPNCGPQLELWDATGSVVANKHGALLEASAAIREGKIVALKGLGGFQLLVDARNDEAVGSLRARKRREEKPFALMYPSIAAVRMDCEISDIEERLLLSSEAPIVLVPRRRETNNLSDSVAPRNPYWGVMLPYSPLHLILMRELGFPIVATSGNLSDEPICINENEAVQKLARIADLFLVHDRPIERQVDDSVVRIMAGRTQIIRRARGFAPFPIQVQNSKSETENWLAVGGHLKNTIAMNSGKNVFLSQHIGDLSTAEALQAFGKVISDFQRLYERSPKVIVHDLHPGYLSTQFAAGSRGEKLGVQHHFAHIASCMAENELDGKVLGISWDGTGYGEDGTIWGGEFLVTDGRTYDRFASLRHFTLPGGTASIKEPRRTALGVLYEIFGDSIFEQTDLPPVRSFNSTATDVLKKVLGSRLNCPVTTSAGRLFDAVASLIGIRQIVNFEGQGAMELEFALERTITDELYDYTITEGRMKGTGLESHYAPELIIDWEPMIREIIADMKAALAPGTISARFHNTLVAIIVAVAEKANEEKVVLSGGCFQNKYLTERAVELLSEKGYKVYWHQRVPTNDGGISLGQIFVAMKQMEMDNAGSKKQETRSKNYEIRTEEQ